MNARGGFLSGFLAMGQGMATFLSRPEGVRLVEVFELVQARVGQNLVICYIFTRKFIHPPSDGRRCSHAAPTGHQVAPDAVSSHDGIVSACD